jgi:hypothetical protein
MNRLIEGQKALFGAIEGEIGSFKYDEDMYE